MRKKKEVGTCIACIVGSSTAWAGDNKVTEPTSFRARLARENAGCGKTCERKECGREGEFHYELCGTEDERVFTR